MCSSVELVFNNPYLLADIMRQVAFDDKLHNTLAALCTSKAFRNPHVVSETLRSLHYVYKPLRERIKPDTAMTCIDIDHVNDTIRCSRMEIDALVPRGECYDAIIPFGYVRSFLASDEGAKNIDTVYSHVDILNYGASNRPVSFKHVQSNACYISFSLVSYDYAHSLKFSREQFIEVIGRKAVSEVLVMLRALLNK